MKLQVERHPQTFLVEGIAHLDRLALTVIICTLQVAKQILLYTCGSSCQLYRCASASLGPNTNFSSSLRFRSSAALCWASSTCTTHRCLAETVPEPYHKASILTSNRVEPSKPLDHRLRSAMEDDLYCFLMTELVRPWVTQLWT